jgi:hypothetical protein
VRVGPIGRRSLCPSSFSSELHPSVKGKAETIATDLYDSKGVKALIAKIDGETRHIHHLLI